VYPDPDPDIADFVHKEYWSAVIDAQIYRTSSVPMSLSAFTRELQVRCTGLDRVRLKSFPRWHAQRKGLFPAPPSPPVYSRSTHVIFENKCWLEGEWGYEWDARSTILGCPQAFCKIYNYGKCFGDMCASQDESLTYSNIKNQIESGLFLKDNSTYFPYKDVEHKFFTAYQNVDMNWVAALRSMFDDPDAVIGPVLFDTGCLRSCTPNLDDFVGELEYGDFGRVQTAEKDTYHTIRARGLMRLHVIDSLG
jgi:hypothetical protein